MEGSNLPVGARVAVYAAVGLALNGPFVFVWGLTGPGWDATPPDVVTAAIQIAITLAAAVFLFFAAWFLVRIDRRDWWLGAVFAWPWIAAVAVIDVGSALSQPPDLGSIFIGEWMLLFAAVPLAGSMLGRRSQWVPVLRSSKPAAPGKANQAKAARSPWFYVRAFVRAFIESYPWR
jgi:hypothetical protein